MPPTRYDSAASSWPAVIEPALREMGAFLRSSDWRGRENEAVNLFTHRFLAARVSPSGPLRSPRQVGIEVAVRQVVGDKKQYVRKDLVIWPGEDMTAFVGEGIPAVVIECKRGGPERCAGDVAWLGAFCDRYPGVIGYAAWVRLAGDRGCGFIRVGA